MLQCPLVILKIIVGHPSTLVGDLINHFISMIRVTGQQALHAIQFIAVKKVKKEA